MLAEGSPDLGRITARGLLTHQSPCSPCQWPLSAQPLGQPHDPLTGVAASKLIGPGHFQKLRTWSRACEETPLSGRDGHKGNRLPSLSDNRNCCTPESNLCYVLWEESWEQQESWGAACEFPSSAVCREPGGSQRLRFPGCQPWLSATGCGNQRSNGEGALLGQAGKAHSHSAWLRKPPAIRGRQKAGGEWRGRLWEQRAGSTVAGVDWWAPQQGCPGVRHGLCLPCVMG